MDRRELLKWGGTALAAAYLGEVIAPPKARAAGKANPRNTARNCIIIMMGGAISHVDCWDFKDTRYTPKDIDVQKFTSDISLSKTLFSHAAEYVDKIALMQNIRANE